MDWWIDQWIWHELDTCSDNTFFYTVNTLVSYIAPLLSDSGGQLYGVATEEDFVNIIANTTSSRDRGCFRNGAGIYTYQRITNDKLPHVFLSIIFKIDGYLLNYMFLILGIYFNNINGSNIQFTIRCLTHEISYSQYWFTDKVTNDLIH